MSHEHEKGDGCAECGKPVPAFPAGSVTIDSKAGLPNGITSYIHCGKCITEWREMKMSLRGISPADYSKTQAGRTEDGGLQVWCNRHECNVAEFTFELKH